MGTGVIVSELPGAGGEFMSHHSQWLPSDVAIGSDGAMRFLSYINSMHPEGQAKLYTVTADLLQHCIPLFKRVLSFAAAYKMQHRVLHPGRSKCVNPLRVDINECIVHCTSLRQYWCTY